MLKKLLAATLMAALLLGGAAEAYDLPKIKPDKKITKKDPSKPEKQIVLKSDWRGAELFEQTMKEILSSGKELAPDDPARFFEDKNYVFIAFYKDAPYFLDRYSIKVRQNSDGVQSWEQNIFPISKNVSPRNATSTHQKFCLADGKFFNAKSPKPKEALSAVTDEADRIFLQECFKVGYRFAFGEEVPKY